MVLDFSIPVQAYKWLSCLQPHQQFGCLIKPSLHLKKNYLGFSFNSNQYGLRGPFNSNPDMLIIGTSYAMGFSVDIGKNWYDLLSTNLRLTNIGLPVGFVEWKNIYENYQLQSAHTALVLYHCNFFSHEEKFSKWRNSNKPIDQFFNWKKNYWQALLLQNSRKYKYQRKERKRTVTWKSRQFLVDLQYAKPNKIYDEVWTEELKKFLSNFKEIKLIRILCKEEVLGRLGVNTELTALANLHENNWLKTLQSLNELNIKVQEIVPNEPDFFLTNDSHLSEEGNIFLSNLISKHIA